MESSGLTAMALTGRAGDVWSWNGDHHWRPGGAPIQGSDFLLMATLCVLLVLYTAGGLTGAGRARDLEAGKWQTSPAFSQAVFLGLRSPCSSLEWETEAYGWARSKAS